MTRYEIRVSGGNALDWAGWFRELQVKPAVENGRQASEIFLTGWFPDQSALMGVLMRLHNLNLAIISIQKIEEEGTKND